MRQAAIIAFTSFALCITATAGILPYHRFPDSLPSNLSKAEKLRLFNRAFYSNLSIDDSCIVNFKINYSAYEDSSIQSPCLLYNEKLTLQNKADIIKVLIKWPGILLVDTIQHSIWLNYVVPRKEYNKKMMKQLSERYAAIIYAWLLPQENIKRWTMLIHFEKQNKHRIIPFCHRVYNYVGEEYYYFLHYPTFDEALNNQLKQGASMKE